MIYVFFGFAQIAYGNSKVQNSNSKEQVGSQVLVESIDKPMEIIDLGSKIGEHPHPDHIYIYKSSAFAVFHWDDDASGEHIGLIDLGGKFTSKKWNYGSNEQRIWIKDEWSRDVDEFMWLPEGDFLVVSTVGMYGSCALYLINLEEKRSTKICSCGKNKKWDLKSIRDVEGTYKITVTDAGKKREVNLVEDVEKK